MEDRTPTPGQEGRVLITPENGSAPFYAKVTMADNPTNPGTPLNKASLLTDETAQAYGFTTEQLEGVVPDDVLAAIKPLIDAAQSTANAAAVVEYGSYVGTGRNSQSILFSGTPQVVFISGRGSDTFPTTATIVKGISDFRVQVSNDGIMQFSNISWGENLISWDSDAKYAPNIKGETYYYAALTT